MKIVYSARDDRYAAIQLAAALAHLKAEFQIAAYPASGSQIDFFLWNLNSKNTSLIKRDLLHFKPDLAIIDYEPFMAQICHEMKLPIIYCSPYYLLMGAVWTGESKGLLNMRFSHLDRWPDQPPGSCLVYSPFGDLFSPPPLKDGFDWVVPYHRPYSNGIDNQIYLDLSLERKSLLKKILHPIKEYQVTDSFELAGTVISHGETHSIANTLYSGKRLLLTPDHSNIEMMMNSQICHLKQIGFNLGQVELAEDIASFEVYTALSKFTHKIKLQPKLPYLHQKVEEICKCYM